MHDVTSLLPPRLDRTDLEEYLRNSWDLYEWLFSGVRAEGALYESPDPLRNPLIFYLGHTAAFYINKLVVAGLLADGVDPVLDSVFARGVDPATEGDLPVRDQWPSEERTYAYRRECFARILEVVRRAPAGERVDEAHPYWALHMGLEHDRIHFETSSVLIRQARLELVARPDGWEYAPLESPEPHQGWVEIGSSRVRLGKPATVDTFGWDNEYGSRVGDVPGFSVQRNLVTNGEFAEFVEDGGYRDRRLWSEEGWGWRQEHGVSAPRFWAQQEGGWRYRATFDEMPLPTTWPAEVSWLEAEAYRNWFGGGARLLTELEFNAVTSGYLDPDSDVVFTDGCNLNLRYGSPSPVGFLPSATSPEGVNDVFGNVWTWLADSFSPLSGFRPHPCYSDFSAPYFDDDHKMMLGGSWASSGTSASRFYRLWFRKYFYQHAGFRLARSLG